MVTTREWKVPNPHVGCGLDRIRLDVGSSSCRNGRYLSFADDFLESLDLAYGSADKSRLAMSNE